MEGPLPYARLVARSATGSEAQRLELVLELARNGGSNGPIVRKQVRINGVPKRGLDLVGRLRVVLFLPEDVSLVAGAPAERRRYLDIALCQIAPSYCRALSEYNKVLSPAQRAAAPAARRGRRSGPARLLGRPDGRARQRVARPPRRAIRRLDASRRTGTATSRAARSGCA